MQPRSRSVCSQPNRDDKMTKLRSHSLLFNPQPALFSTSSCTPSLTISSDTHLVLPPTCRWLISLIHLTIRLYHKLPGCLFNFSKARPRPLTSTTSLSFKVDRRSLIRGSIARAASYFLKHSQLIFINVGDAEVDRFVFRFCRAFTSTSKTKP